jgi:hypothetical protein
MARQILFWFTLLGCVPSSMLRDSIHGSMEFHATRLNRGSIVETKAHLQAIKEKFKTASAMDTAEYCLKYLAGTANLCIHYGRTKDGKIEGRELNRLWGWVDADFAADLDTSRSHTGYVIMMNGGPPVSNSALAKSGKISLLLSPQAQAHANQTVLLAREMARMMKWDGDSKHTVNIHFGKVNETRKALGYLDDLTLDDVLKSVLMATLKASVKRTLRDAYHNILDDLDDDKELTFALMQQACARQFRRVPDRERRPDTPRSDRATPRTLPAKPDIKYLCQGVHGPDPYNKYTCHGAQNGGPAAYLCTYLDNHGVKPENVVKKAGLAGPEWDDPASVNTLYVASTKFWPCTVRSDSDADADSDADDYAAGAASASDDSD